MMFRSFGRVALASLFSIGLASLLTSCDGGGHSIGFAYVIGTNPCQIYIYNVNSSNGALSQASTASISCPSGVGSALPVFDVVTPDFSTLYVLFGASGQPGTIASYSISQSNGSLTPQSTVSTAGLGSTSLAMDPGGNYLYAVDTFAAGQTSGIGVLSFYSIGSNGALTASTCTGGTVVNSACSYPVGYTPIGATQLFNGTYVYVANAGDQSVSTCSGSVSGFSVTSSGLTPVPFSVPRGACPGGGSPAPSNTLPMGVQPAGITSDPSSSFVYVTDYVQNQVYANQVQTSNGNLSTSITGGVTGQGYPTGGNGPRNVIVDPRGQYVYIANSVAGTIAGFTLNKSTGALASISGSPYNAGTTPLCLGVEPLQGEFLYAVNQLSGSVSAYKLTGNTGQLSGVPNQPFQISSNSGSAPVCLATAANGPTPSPGTP